MTRKTNITSLKLAKTQIWPIFLQKYGNSFFTTFYNLKLYYSFILFLKLINKTYNLTFSIAAINLGKKISITLYYYVENQNQIVFNTIRNHFRILKYYFTTTCSVKFYYQTNTFSAILLSNYLFQLSKKKSLKQMFLLIFSLLESNINF